jgi:hypothetical protein
MPQFTNGTNAHGITPWILYRETYLKCFAEYRQKPKFKEYMSNYYKTKYSDPIEKEKKNEYQYNYYHSEVGQEKRKEYYAKNRELIIEKNKAYYFKKKAEKEAGNERYN